MSRKVITIPSVSIRAALKRRSPGPAEGDFRVWHIPQVPGKPFYVDLNHVPRDEAPQEAKRILKILADYDLFQLEHNIKADYTNAQGLEVFEDGEWVEWWNDDGEDISDIMRREP